MFTEDRFKATRYSHANLENVYFHILEKVILQKTDDGLQQLRVSVPQLQETKFWPQWWKEDPKPQMKPQP